jgi:electron transport complex protein RnfC
MFELSRLWRFPGGLRLDAHKHESTRLPVVAAQLPGQLILPLQDYDGNDVAATVAPGQRLDKGQRLTGLDGEMVFHAPSSGRVVGIEHRPLAHPSNRSAPCIVIATDGEERWGEHRLTPLVDFDHYSPQQLLRRVHEAGVSGLGGAAFPSARKLAAADVELLIVNGVECEPYISCDDMLMRARAREVVGGVLIMRHILRSRRNVIAIEEDKPEAYQAVAAALAELGAEADIVLRAIPALYPGGGERQLIRILTGYELAGDSYPTDAGIVCHNVATAAALYAAVVHGRPLLSRYVSVTGEGVARPRVLEVLLGTPVAELIAQCGGYTGAAQRLIIGGPMMGFALHDDAAAITRGSHCVLVQRAPPPAPALPCIRCGACVGVCPVRLLPQQLYQYSRAGDFEQAQAHHLFDCIECGCCAVVCPSRIALVDYYREAKTEIRRRRQQRLTAQQARRRYEARQQRLEREQKERTRRLRQKTAASDQDTKKAAIQAALARVKKKREKNSPGPGGEGR